jgi:hypothetical protein
MSEHEHSHVGYTEAVGLPAEDLEFLLLPEWVTWALVAVAIGGVVYWAYLVVCQIVYRKPKVVEPATPKSLVDIERKSDEEAEAL